MEIIYDATKDFYVVINKGKAIGEFGYIPEYNWWKVWHNKLDFGTEGADTIEEAFDDLMEMESRKDIPFWE